MLGANWQIYSYMPTISHDSVAPSPVLSSEKNVSSLPSFLRKTMTRLASKYKTTFDKDRSCIDCKVFYLDIGYDDENRVVRIYGFGVKDKEAHNNGTGKEILQYFFSSLSIYSPKDLEVTLWSVSTAIGFYLRCGMAIQAAEDTYVDPVETYYKRKAELFGNEWDKYKLTVTEQIGTNELLYDDVFPIFESSDFYQEGDHPGVFSMWLEDILGYRSHHMIFHVESKRSPSNGFRV